MCEFHAFSFIILTVVHTCILLMEQNRRPAKFSLVVINKYIPGLFDWKCFTRPTLSYFYEPSTRVQFRTSRVNLRFIATALFRMVK